MERPPVLLRVLLAVVRGARWLAPASRRDDWRRQWEGDIWHQWQWLDMQSNGKSGRAVLAARTAGAVSHAIWLRLHVRRLDMITQDLRYGWRLMLRQPAFTAVAILTLSLGIGANVTIFSWVRTMLDPLGGIPDSDRLVVANGTTRTRTDLSMSYPNFAELRRARPDSVEDLVAHNLVPLSIRDLAHTGGTPQRIYAQLVSGNVFDAFGIRPILGRGFLPEEDRTPNDAAVVVFSHAFWMRRFGGDPAVVGKPVSLNGRPFTVVGVAPAEFKGVALHVAADGWVPMMMQTAVLAGDRLGARSNSWLQILVKLKPGASIERAQADFDVIARNLAEAFPENRGRGIRLFTPWRAAPTTVALVATVGVLMAVAVVVLLIGCANVASLLLARAAGRQRETAIRLALGAGRGRLVRQLLTESALLAIAGGALGIVFAYWTVDLAQVFVPPTPLPIDVHPRVDRLALTFAVGLTALSIVVFGLAPAFQGASESPMGRLKERTRIRRAIVVAQVALSLVLMVAAALFARTLKNAQAIDPGFSMRTGLFASVDLLPAGYDPDRGRRFFRDLLARVREVPGVEAASLARRVPLGFGGTSDTRVRVDGYTPAPNEEMTVYWNSIGSDYLRTMGITLVDGRDITDRDTADVPEVGVVNEAFVHRYFQGRRAIGGRVHFGDRTIEIVGVARDGKYTSVTEAPRAFMYLPVPQWYRPDAVLHVKTAGDPLAILPQVQEAVRRVDPNVPLFEVRTVADHLEVSTFLQRMAASLVGGFGLLAVLLAAVGLYGVIATTVVQRTPEIGMRMALGASRGAIVALILRQGLGLTLTGVAIGLLVAVGAMRLVGGLLVGVSATDTLSFTGASIGLVVIAAAAAYLPARRAAAVDPILALRNE